MDEPGDGQWLVQGGANVAEDMLARRYDPSTQTWSVPQVGIFWDAVSMARDLGRHGDGVTIAVVDDGFDLGVPPLGEHGLAWPAADADLVTHGTVVALLVLAVAPRARLLLYPAAVDGAMDPDRVARAITDAADRGAAIINLSFGQAVRTEKVVDVGPVVGDPVLATMTATERQYRISKTLGELDGWRTLLRTVDSDVTRATRAAAERGCTVVAAAGNYRGFVFSPASELHTISVGFQGELRSLDDAGVELAEGTAPTFWQSEWSDLTLRQPENVLGSSFATPLLAGFAALMEDRADLRNYREVVRLAGLAAMLFVDPTRPPDWDENRHGVIKYLYEKAVGLTPTHDHLLPFFELSPGSVAASRAAQLAEAGEVELRCPECSLLAADAFINLGLFRLEHGDRGGARRLLEAARAFAPENEHAAANLGVTYGALAREAQQVRDWPTVVDLLQSAAACMEAAIGRRPDSVPYRNRYEEFSAAVHHPRDWEMAP